MTDIELKLAIEQQRQRALNDPHLARLPETRDLLLRQLDSATSPAAARVLTDYAIAITKDALAIKTEVTSILQRWGPRADKSSTGDQDHEHPRPNR